MQLPKSSIRTTAKVGKIKLHYEKQRGFTVTQNKINTPVKIYDVDPTLRTISSSQLDAFLKENYVAVDKLSNGDFTINAKVRGLGAGPYTAYTVYCATKAALIGGLVVGTTAAVCVTGGAAASAAGAVAAGTATVGGTATGVIAASTTSVIASATVSTGAGAVIAGAAVVGGADAAIAGTAFVASATLASAAAGTGTVVGTGALAGATTALIAAIEAASIAAAAPFLASPWCP